MIDRVPMPNQLSEAAMGFLQLSKASSLNTALWDEVRASEGLPAVHVFPRLFAIVESLCDKGLPRMVGLEVLDCFVREQLRKPNRDPLLGARGKQAAQ